MELCHRVYLTLKKGKAIMFGCLIKWSEDFVSIFHKFHFDVYFHLYTQPFEKKNKNKKIMNFLVYFITD